MPDDIKANDQLLEEIKQLRLRVDGFAVHKSSAKCNYNHNIDPLEEHCNLERVTLQTFKCQSSLAENLESIG